MSVQTSAIDQTTDGGLDNSIEEYLVILNHRAAAELSRTNRLARIGRVLFLLRTLIDHWEEDRVCNLVPTVATLKLAKSSISDAFADLADIRDQR